MPSDNHNPPELAQQHDPAVPGPPAPNRRPDLVALLVILIAGLVAVLIGHLDVTGAVTLLTALVGLYATYRRA